VKTKISGSNLGVRGPLRCGVVNERGTGNNSYEPLYLRRDSGYELENTDELKLQWAITSRRSDCRKLILT
jgi:hypothetical protein